MNIEYNLLSGASINNQLRLIYELLRSGESYLGFSRGHETWGQGTLVRYKAISGQLWPNDIIGPSVHAQIYDDNHRLMNISTDGTTSVHVARLRIDTSDTRLHYPESATDNRLTYLMESNGGIVNGMDNVECIFANEKWMLLRGVNPTFEFYINDQTDPNITYKYFIMNFNKDMNNVLEIDNVSEYQYPGLEVKVQLKYGSAGLTDVTQADLVPYTSELRRRFNLIGEYIVTGIGEDFITWFETDDTAKNSTFFLVDADGALLIDGVRFEETVVNDAEKAYIFAYDVQEGNNTTRKVRFKITTMENINDRAAVFKESMPVETHVAPIADNNPPGLPVSYVRSLDIHESIFDVVGLRRLAQQDVWLAMELPAPYPANPGSPTEPITAAENPVFYQYWEMTQSMGDPDILSLDELVIDEDVLENISFKKVYARSKDLSFASTQNFNLIIVDIELDGNTPTGDIYRQLFISWKPKKFNATTNTFVPTVNENYTGRNTFFHPDDHKVDMGTLFYLANKMPIYRMYIDGTEKFKIIL